MREKNKVLVIFVALLLFGTSIGLTDDEAYYWVLSRRPALSYAFHPPMIAWLIALAQPLVDWAAQFSPGQGFGQATATTAWRILGVRGPTIALLALTLAIGWRWACANSGGRARWGAILGLPVLFALGWMSVPDVPLISGITLCLYGTWLWIQRSASDVRKGFAGPGLYMGLGTVIAILSKYSGILVPVSAALCLLLEYKKLGRRWLLGCAVLLGATAVALTPLLIWNAHHGWGSLLYQVRERHGDLALSWVRYGRFWVIQAVLVGPSVFTALFMMLKRAFQGSDPQACSLARFSAIWVLVPGLVFFTQPLFAEFKPHWTLAAWWPLVLWLAVRETEAGYSRALAFTQRVYTTILVAAVWSSFSTPWISRFWAAARENPLLDVSNDVFGWDEVAKRLRRDPDYLGGRPVLASRYQTASQMAFYLNDSVLTTLVPRDLKAMDEWPRTGATDSEGPEWPRVVEPFFYVRDQRYSELPAYVDGKCVPWMRHIPARGNAKGNESGTIRGKWIEILKCEPAQPQS